MFFAKKIISIGASDKVLEIGPGATPHPRADVFLEKIFETEAELIAQSGHVGTLNTQKPVVTYKGEIFPFKDNEFDYVICSHVIEHVDNVEQFLAEICRVSKKGYLEFPIIYYEYLYNIEEHLNVLYYDGIEIKWMKKADTPIPPLKALTDFFRTSQFKGYRMQTELNEAWHQGFEWENIVKARRVSDWHELCYDKRNLEKIIPPPTKRGERFGVKYGFNIMVKSIVKKFRNQK